MTAALRSAAAFVVALNRAIGEDLEKALASIPGWSRFEGFVDDVIDGLAFGIALIWEMRWCWVVLAVGILAGGAQ